MRSACRLALAAWAVLFAFSSLAAADPVAVSLSGTRTRFTNAEPVELVASVPAEQAREKVSLEILHADGSLIALEVPPPANAPGTSRLVTLYAGALKPGSYTARAAGGDDEHSAGFSIHNDEHPNAYFTAQWVHHGATPGTPEAKGGWMYMNSDYVSLHPRVPKAGDIVESYIAGGMKPYPLMVFGGGHQLDLDLENDWGDPWVQRALVWRMNVNAVSNRIYPLPGQHCYDEPGLTWWPFKDADGKTTGMSPFAVPHQLEEFTKLTGKQIPAGPFEEVGPKLKPILDDWLDFMEMRMKYLTQSWHATVWGTQAVRPDWTTLNQVSSSYAPGATTDGVDSRQNRPYRILSGHGGYSDMPFGTFQPIRSAESYQGFARDRKHYYVPMWYTHNWATVRNGVWMSWATKLEGIIHTPEHDFELNNDHASSKENATVFEIAEINRRLALVGGVMNQLPKTTAPVAVLHSYIQTAADIAEENHPQVYPHGSPQYQSPHRQAVDACFFHVLETGMAPNWIDEVEALHEGAEFLKQWKVIFCPRLTVARPEFRQVLEEYVAGGGKLIQLKDDKLRIEGSILADHGFGDTGQYWRENLHEKPASNAGTDLAWRKWNRDLAPTFSDDLRGWLGEPPYQAASRDVLLGVHRAGEAVYLLMANNAQDADNPRGVKHELLPLETEVKLPEGGVVYDLFEGGRVKVENARAPLRLAAGDGACWLHLPEPPGVIELRAELNDRDPFGSPSEVHVAISLKWGRLGCLPFRLRIIAPGGQRVAELYRATGETGFQLNYPLGANASPGTWKVEVYEWLEGTTTTAEVEVEGGRADVLLASLNRYPVSIYFDDAKRIAALLAGKPLEPDYDDLNWDAKRVFGLEPKKFAVFGPEDTAGRIAEALRGKGMTVDVNPPYAIEPFKREPNRGGAGPVFREANFENIYAHTIVLPGAPLLEESNKRGHINRPVTAAFPGPGRAFIQWGISCYQAGWQNVFVLGDVEVGTRWLLEAIEGEVEPQSVAIKGESKPAPAQPSGLKDLAIRQQIKTYDTPVGVGAGPDGSTYILLYDGSLNAYDREGKELWSTKPLMLGGALAVSPKGDRIAVCGYPGLAVLDAEGKVLGESRAEPLVGSLYIWTANEMVGVAWNSAGTLAAGCWKNSFKGNDRPLEKIMVLDAQGQPRPSPEATYEHVRGVAFVPGGDVLLVGAEKLTAIDLASGKVLWSNDIGSAQAFAFTPDGKTGGAGGHGELAGIFSLDDGHLIRQAKLPGMIGGVAFTPGGDLAVAVWGRTNPLYILRLQATEPRPLFQAQFGFQNVVWSPGRNALIAAEQGGRLWQLQPDGRPVALLDDAGTTAYRIVPVGEEVLVGRMNRVVQVLSGE